MRSVDLPDFKRLRYKRQTVDQRLKKLEAWQVVSIAWLALVTCLLLERLIHQ
jgi:hypothetical protein